MIVCKSQLKDQTGTSYPRPILLCGHCGAEYSANSGDYWDVPENHVFKCCGEPMSLVVKREIYEEVKL